MFDYKSSTEWPFFKVDFNLYPNKDQQINFLSSYIDVMIPIQDQSVPHINGITNDTCREELINQIMKEANYFALASHFFWALWSINMATSTAIKFGYMEYARTRLTAYYLTRDMIIGANQMPPQFDEDLLRSNKNPFNTSYLKTDNSKSSLLQ